MKIETLNERIAKAEEKIAKEQNTIAKKTALIEKKTAGISNAATENDRYWITCEINYLHDDILRLGREIKETESTLENYRAQLAGEIKRQELLTKEVPENLKQLQTELVTGWDEHDMNARERIKKDRREMDYDDFKRKYRGRDTSIEYKTDAQIHDSNVRDAESIILDLVNRVKEITGEITSWAGVTVRAGNGGWSVLNGYVTGKEGRACVESIGAGGYNIQRYHIRVLVKPIN